MKSIRLFYKIVVIITLCGITSAFAGCTIFKNKDEALDKYNKVIQSVGGLSLTKDHALQGKRYFGTDHYVGTYTAAYDHFSNTEYLFGGTSIKRESGKKITVTCNIDISEGTAQLIYVSGSNEPKILTETSGKYSATIELKGGGSYFGVTGDRFTGKIDLVIKDAAEN